MLKRMGESRHPCRTPTVVRNQSPMLLLKRTALMLVIDFFNDLDKVCADVEPQATFFPYFQTNSIT